MSAAPTALGLSAGTIDTGRLARANPTAKLLTGVVLALGALLASDAVTPALVLAASAVAARIGGVPLAVIARRTWPLLVSAVGIGLTNVLFTGAAQPWLTGLAATVRVLALGLPGITLLLTIDPTDLADSLVQQARVPAKFAYGSLAALRLLPLLADEWRTIGLARRARGIDAGHNPLRALRLFAGQTFALLVSAIRRGSRLAVAMDARGFDAAARRSHARQVPLRWSDRAMVSGAVVIVAAALLVSAALGTLRLF